VLLERPEARLQRVLVLLLDLSTPVVSSRTRVLTGLFVNDFEILRYKTVIVIINVVELSFVGKYVYRIVTAFGRCFKLVLRWSRVSVADLVRDSVSVFRCLEARFSSRVIDTGIPSVSRSVTF